jgi:hypothetical protein
MDEILTMLLKSLASGAGISGPILGYLLWKDYKREEANERRWQSLNDAHNHVSKSIDYNTVSINTLIVGIAGIPKEAKAVASDIIIKAKGHIAETERNEE